MQLNTWIIISYTCFIGIFKKFEVVMVQVLVAVKLWWWEGARGCQVPRGAIFPKLLKLKGLKKIGVFIIFSCEINKNQN